MDELLLIGKVPEHDLLRQPPYPVTSVSVWDLYTFHHRYACSVRQVGIHQEELTSDSVHFSYASSSWTSHLCSLRPFMGLIDATQDCMKSSFEQLISSTKDLAS